VKPGLTRAALIGLGLLLALGLIVLLIQGGSSPAIDWLKTLEARIAQHFWLVLGAYVVSFVLLVLIGAPVGTVFCLSGGYLFGVTIGTLAALTGATLGAIANFMMVRALGGKAVRERLNTGVSDRLLKQLDRDAAWYLILLRVIPFAPFFPVNAAAAMTEVKPGLFSLATLVGLVPTTIIYAAIGNGLGSILEAQELVGMQLFMRPQIWAPIAGLVILMIGGILLHHRQSASNH
jgi:uncharacterized membrane protein YdjX (TVP38/TMEM64 family)